MTRGKSWAVLGAVVVVASLGFGIWIVTHTHTTAMGNVVLFGDDNINSNPLNNTWTWNGTTWTQLFPAASPPARSDASMVYDPAEGNVVLFGG